MTHEKITTGVLIVGAGHAGAQAALMLRQLGYTGAVALVGEDASPPYERPPLSKDYLAGTEQFENILIRPREEWAELKIDLFLGRKVVAVDSVAHEVQCDNGDQIRYDKMIWAAGGVPRRLEIPGGDLTGIHVIRSRAEVDAIRSRIDDANNIVIVGGGYIGLEAASAFNEMGKNICVLEAKDRLLSRVAGTDLSKFYELEHRDKGVEIRFNAQIESFIGANNEIAEVTLAGGELLPADLVILGIGILPVVGPLIAAGAEGALGGVKVDEFCRTTLPDVYAVGDCAAHINRFADAQLIRLESVQNAHDQATIAVSDVVGDSQPYDTVPWFWSDQYDLKLQTAGISAGYEHAVLRGDPNERSFSVVYLKEDRVIALDCVNATRDYAHGRRLIAQGGLCDFQAISDTQMPLLQVKSV